MLLQLLVGGKTATNLENGPGNDIASLWTLVVEQLSVTKL